MAETCILCEHHVWSDNNWYHVCLKNNDGKEIRADAKPCVNWKMSLRGKYNITGYTNVYNTDDIDGKVKDDKYTRGKGDN